MDIKDKIAHKVGELLQTDFDSRSQGEDLEIFNYLNKWVCSKGHNSFFHKGTQYIVTKTPIHDGDGEWYDNIYIEHLSLTKLPWQD